MKIPMACLAIFVGQMITLQSKPVVHMEPNRHTITADLGGKVLELINARATVYLPAVPPKGDSPNSPWSVDIKNLGPAVVMVFGPRQFDVHINVGQTVHINSTGSGYSLH